MSSLPMLPKVSHDPLMHGWDFVVAVSQESINTNLVTGDAVRRTVQRRDGGASFDARFAASRIELLSANQAILWICVEPGFQSNGKDDRHRQVISEPLQLAFHVHLKLKSTSPVSATGRSVWEIYIGTANVSFLPQYSVLHLGDDGVDSGYHTLRDLIDFTATSFIPSLSANKQNVVVRIPILDAAAGSSSPYTMVNAQFRTAFGRRRATVDTVTVENWHETMSQPRTFSPIILGAGDPALLELLVPRADVINGLSIGTLAIAKDAQIVERVIPAQLARLNAITTLVPMVHLGYKYSCPGMVYLESSGDGTNAADGMWQPVQAVDAVHSASRTYVYQSTSSCTTTTVVNGVTERTQTYTCKTTNKLTMSNMFSPELAITMTGNIELSCSDSKLAHFRSSISMIRSPRLC
ncbi:hypothetical protein C8Q70DRAFT_1018155 [Cubamyces menziesii]|nr:hypothetical protein C8Q70DRAFT_1018155 [Cubamyces menziesii]